MEADTTEVTFLKIFKEQTDTMKVEQTTLDLIALNQVLYDMEQAAKGQITEEWSTVDSEEDLSGKGFQLAKKPVAAE